MGNLDAAKNYLDSAISAFPDSDLAYNNLAFMLWNYFKEYKEAKKNIKIALKISPKDGLYWHTLAEVEWYGFKNRKKALEALHQAKAVQPSYKAADAMIAEIEKTA
jgi:tetratricopeptide (TPR) repeat protein